MGTASATKHEHGERRAFRNTTNGWVGAMQYAPNGDEKAVAVEPGGVVWLSEAEQELTAKAPREAKSNPFEPQPYEVRDVESDEVTEKGSRPLLVPDTEERPIPGQSPLYDHGAEAPEGSHAKGEEVGTPPGKAE